MKQATNKKSQALFIGLLYGVLSGLPVLADDTEIFFGSSSQATDAVLPNVMFILDTSSSMTSTDGVGISRLDRMKDALNQILTNATNINVGLMRFSRSGGPVLYPVAPIDKDICEIEDCTANSSPNVQTRIKTGADDAEENSIGVVSLSSSDLEMINDPVLAGATETVVTYAITTGNDDVEQRESGDVNYNSSDIEFVYDGSKGNQAIGLRFLNIALDSSMTITSAVLEFQVDEPGSGTISVDVYGHDHDNSPAFSNTAGERVRDRTKTSAKIDWDNISNPDVGQKLSSPNLKSIVEEIISSPSWSSGHAMTFLIEKDPASASGSGNKRVVETYNGSSAPQLKITYLSGGGVADTTQTIGLRFQDVGIPQGATITSASLEFEVDETDSVATSLLIAGENVDDAAAFAETPANISSRSTTTATTAWSNIPTWDTVGAKKQSPDITDIVQEIVNRSGWCGGNAMAFKITGSGKRTVVSFDGSSGNAPLLKIAYDPDTIPANGGCLNQSIVKRVSSGGDDAEEKTDGTLNTSSSDLEFVNDGLEQVIGLRFRNLSIPQGATVLQANLSFEIDETPSGNSSALSLNIYGDNTDDAVGFSSTNNVSSRPKTTAVTNWVLPTGPSVNQTITTPSITSIVQEIVNRANWTSDNDMAFILERASGSGKRTVESYNGEPGAAPRLFIKIQYDAGATTEETLVTVRDRLIQEVDNLQYKSGTPIVDTLYEAALYFRGDEVLYGKARGNNPLTTSRSEYTRVSHPASYTGGNLTQPTGCTSENLNAYACKGETITGTPLYDSPITESCQRSYVVLLSDGFPSYNESADEIKAMAGIGSCANSGSAACGPELAKFLYENDQRSAVSLAGTQNVTTYTIGFNFSGSWLDDVARAGGGAFYEASSSADLVNVFDAILREIAEEDTTFVSPSATVNQFNRFTHRNELYFSLFKPDDKPYWPGNLKRYKLDGTQGDIVDVNDVLAVDSSTGFFKSTSQSFWSNAVDGNDVTLGGAASMLSLTDRKVYTYTGTSTTLSDSSNVLSENNSAITNAMLGVDATMDTSDLLKWARGVDVLDYNENTNTTEIRKQMADPLHSVPVVVTYGGTSASPDNVIYFATNDGFLYAIDADDGSEIFSFIPQELLPLLEPLYTNSSATTHPYGLDGSITTWVNDVDGDGIIETGDHVYLYVGMRRGGRNYYALDVTDRNAPELLWTIKGGIIGNSFEELGQTWSKPIVTKLQISTDTPQTVLVFAGGYDDDQDDYATKTADSQGRAIFMVNASDGSLVWSGGDDTAAGSHTETFNDMNYSIPSEVRVIDIDNDGLMDLMFVGDMGGQVWRFDINNGTTLNSLVSGGVIADISGSAAADNRRFYYAPDVAYIVDGNTKYLSIALGSGWRAHPLDEVVEDRFYMIRDSNIFTIPTSYTKLTESNLYNATDNLIGQGTSAEKTTAVTQMAAANGWYIKMENTGEKILADSLTINQQIIFTSYQPNIGAAGSCTAALGLGRVYVVNLKDATPVLNFDTADNGLTKADRVATLTRGGIPPSPTALITEDGSPTILIGPETPVDDINFGSLFGRIYWRQVDD